MMNLLDFDRQGLIDFFAQWGEKPFRATQLLQWVHQQGVSDISQMTNISKALRQRLQDETCVKVPSIVTVQHSNDGTRKWLLQLDDGNCIETVFIPEDDRGTLCVSSQVGCALSCSFCATAQQGFNRNLTLAEIIGQLWIAEHSLRAEGTHKINPMSERIISNVVFMGMGEPLANFNTVVQAIRVMMDDYGYGMSWRRVTVSTAGMVSGIAKLREQCPVHLAISLHATTDALRDELVPLNKKYPIAELLEACRGYVAEDTRRRITFEYVMLKDVNDSLEDARALIKLLRNVPSKVNLIPFNPFPHTQYQRSTPEQIDRFREVLWKGGIVTVTRKTRGDDIDAACGQLAGKVQDRSRRHLKLKNIPILQQGIS